MRSSVGSCMFCCFLCCLQERWCFRAVVDDLFRIVHAAVTDLDSVAIEYILIS